MPLRVDASSPVPLHAQIGEAVRLAIARGELRPGDRLPTVRQLAVDLRVNSNTVARVYQELERVGVVETRRGAGTFVRPGAPPADDGGGEAHRRRLADLCRAFVGNCATEGYTVRDIMHALRELVQEGKDGR